MKIAILSRQGDCFPNIISQGLADMLDQLGVGHKIFYGAIPFLMRLLPLDQKPKRWSNSLQFRIRNKLTYYKEDHQLLKELADYDLIILSECLPNALWKNYLAIETLKQKLGKKIGNYTEGAIGIAPLHRRMLLDADDYEENRFDFNLYVTDTIELKRKGSEPNKKAICVNLSYTGLKPVAKKEFIAVVDFAQKGYEAYREQQLRVLNELGIKTIVLEGRYPIAEIRKIYQQAAIYFLAFPETFGLPIAECLASGSFIGTPNSAWPMAWRLNENPMPWGPGLLPDCFKVYGSDEELKTMLRQTIAHYDKEQTPQAVFRTFIQHYPYNYYGNKKGLEELLAGIRTA